MPLDRQLSFDGREVVQIKTKWGDLELDSLPDGLERQDLADLTLGDVAHCLVRFVVDDVGHSERHDRQGVGTKPLTRKVTFKTLSVGFVVEGVTKRDDAERAWNASHGATA